MRSALGHRRKLWTISFLVFFLPSALFAQCFGGGGAPCFQPVNPILECVDPNPDGSYTAHWGFVNQSSECCPPELYEFPILVPLPDQIVMASYFNPPPIDRGQPTLLPPGNFPNAFTTTWDGTPLSWTIRYLVPTPPFFVDSTATADASQIPVYCESEPPSCDAGGPYMAPCGGTETVVTLDGSGSSDPENDPMTYDWDVVCDGEVPVVDGANTVSPVVHLVRPGQGFPVSCTASLAVTAGGDTSECQSTIDVPACNLDCLGQPNGSAQLDLCGVCNGTNQCVDCLGVPNGGAVVDRCGVCAGNGQSCLGCESVNIVSTQFALDGGAQEQKALVFGATLRYRRVVGSTSSSRKIIRKIRDEADLLATQNWIFTWSLPQVITSCTNQEFCVSVNTSFVTTDYVTNSERLRALLYEVTARIRKRATLRKQIRSARRIEKLADRLHQGNLSNLGLLPSVISTCS